MLSQGDPRTSSAENPLIGRWTYRSFVNEPDISKDFSALEFGRGELVVEYFGLGMFVGRLIFSDTYQFRLLGIASVGDPPTVRLRGFGDAPDSQDQIYDYFGCFIPFWPNGIDQRLTIVGSVIRALPHNGEKARAGVVASFIALKR
jgi:hypothetical protein